MATYNEQLMAWRQQRQQQELSNTLERIRSDHAQAVRERDTAIANNDMESAGFADDDAARLEAEWRQYVPPPPQQFPQQMIEFAKRRQPFVERHGQAAIAAMDMAHNYATRRRNPNTTNPAHAGIGLVPNTPAYYKAMDDLLTLYAKDFGLNYDPQELIPTATDIARDSGISAQSYNQAYAQLKADGRVK